MQGYDPMEHVFMRMWSVYDHPKDYPRNFVARLFEVNSEGIIRRTPSIMVCPDLEMIRAQMIEMGLRCIPQRNEEQKLVEIWV